MVPRGGCGVALSLLMLLSLLGISGPVLALDPASDSELRALEMPLSSDMDVGEVEPESVMEETIIEIAHLLDGDDEEETDDDTGPLPSSPPLSRSWQPEQLSSASGAPAVPLLQDLSPPLLTWRQLQQQIVQARCASNMYRLQHGLPLADPLSRAGAEGPQGPKAVKSGACCSAIPAVCRRPIAVIMTQENPRKCPTCLQFAKELFNTPGHLAALEALRSDQVSVVLHLDPNEPANRTTQRRDGGKAHGIESKAAQPNAATAEHRSFSDTAARHPIPSAFEEDWTLALYEASAPRRATDAAVPAAPPALTQEQLAAGRRGLQAHWAKVRQHPVVREAWQLAYAGEGDYVLKILFLWPHNGTVMPIVGPDWSLYHAAAARAGYDDQEEEEEGEKKLKRNGKHSNSGVRVSAAELALGPLPGPSGVGGSGSGTNSVAHLYASPGDFFRNCLLAERMVSRLHQSYEQ